MFYIRYISVIPCQLFALALTDFLSYGSYLDYWPENDTADGAIEGGNQFNSEQNNNFISFFRYSIVSFLARSEGGANLLAS